MSVPEQRVQSFIVKLWLEDAGDETGKVIWHGYITHVPDGSRHYLKTLNEITDVIERYLEEMGLEPKSQSAVRRWLKRLSVRLCRWSRLFD